MIDIQALKEHNDLLALADRDTQLKRVAATGGGEWAGPCPFCGGQDRFRVQPYYPNGGRWLCRHCTEGKWRDAIAYVMRRDNLDFKTACGVLGAGELPRVRERQPRPEIPAYEAPPGSWQAQARRAIEICECNLWAPLGTVALDYLRNRGLQDSTIKRFRLGYSPGAKFSGLRVHRGLVIPWVMGDSVLALKIRFLPGQLYRCEKCGAGVEPGRCPKCGSDNRYRNAPGSRPAAIFNADDLRSLPVALFVEGEIDCMTAWQILGGMMAVCTLGSASSHFPDLAVWGVHLLHLRLIMAAYDGDPAGENGLANLVLLSERTKLAPLPEGNWKDVNDYFLAGQDLLGWILPYLQAYSQPVCTERPESDLESNERIK